MQPTVEPCPAPASHASTVSAISSTRTAKNSPVPSSPELAGYESARSTPSLDDFGPRSPVSEAMFHGSRLDKESDLHPSDSASQRPARSEVGTIRTLSSDDGERTPAQVLRDTVLGNRLGTVIEETPSQAQSTRVARSDVSNASISSHEVNALLALLEEQQRERASKERELEEQIRGFQRVVRTCSERARSRARWSSARARASSRRCSRN